jgi:hypothetical protein
MGLIALGLLFSPVSYGQETCESDADCEEGEACDSDGVCVRTKKIEDEDLLGSRKKRETQTPKLEKPNRETQVPKLEKPNRETQVPKLEKPGSATIRFVASVGFVGSGSLLMMRGVMLRGVMEVNVRSDSYLNPNGGFCSDCYEDEKFRVNSRLALGYAFLGTGAILGFTRNQSSSGTDVALTWRGQW